MTRAKSEANDRRTTRNSPEAGDPTRPSEARGRPFGYEVDGFTIVPAEAALIVEGARLVLGGRPLGTVITAWTESGVPTVTGRPWTTITVRSTLTSARVAGLRSDRGEGHHVKASWPAILDRATWEQLRARLVAPKRWITITSTAELLTGLAMCGKCGALLWSGVSNGQRCLRCRRRPWFTGCGGLTVPAEPVEGVVTTAVLRVLTTLTLDDTATALKHSKRRGAPDEAFIDLTALEERGTELADLHATADISRRQLVAASRVVDSRRTTPRVGKHGAPSPAMSPRRPVADGLQAAWEDLAGDQRHRVLANVLDRVTIAPEGPRAPRRVFDASRVLIDWKT